MGSWGLAALAGFFTTMSPCVLPVLPLLLGSGFSERRGGPAVMILGMMSSFVFTGLILSRVGGWLAGGPESLRPWAAGLMILFGLIMLVPQLQDRLGEKISGLTGNASGLSRRLEGQGSLGLFLSGALLGIVWSPCVGPTLAIATGLAATEAALSSAFVLLVVYAVAAALPMLAIAYGARGLFQKNKARLLGFAEKSKGAFGFVIILTGLLVLSGADKQIEAWLLRSMNETWVDLISRY